MESGLTTSEAAKAVKIDRITLQRWIHAGKVRAPKLILRNGRGLRLWMPADMQKLRQVKQEIYRKGRGRKKAKAKK